MVEYIKYVYCLCGIILIVGIVVFICIVKRKKNTVQINNDSYTPPMPISNIILDKKRYVYNDLSSTVSPVTPNSKIYLKLIDIIEGKHLNLKGGNIIYAGKSRRCGFVIKSAFVSDIHCIFTFDGSQLFLEDNNSLNGTILNGIKITGRIPVYSGDLILIGEKEYKIESWGTFQ